MWVRPGEVVRGGGRKEGRREGGRGEPASDSTQVFVGATNRSRLGIPCTPKQPRSTAQHGRKNSTQCLPIPSAEPTFETPPPPPPPAGSTSVCVGRAKEPWNDNPPPCAVFHGPRESFCSLLPTCYCSSPRRRSHALYTEPTKRSFL